MTVHHSAPRPGRLLPVATTLCAAALAGACHAAPPGGSAPAPPEPRTDLTDEENRTIALFQEASPAVVHITTLDVAQDYFTRNLLSIPSGTGTGFIWDDQGHVVTNFHVIASAEAAKVTLNDHTTTSATLVGTAPDHDIAVLKIDAPKEKLRSLRLGSSENLLVGQKVFAIGNPFGLDQTLTTGVISGLGREIESLTRRSIRGVIQTDAAINPGNSGGPLLDSSGRLIGVNTAIFSPSGAYAGVGFAVPVDTVSRIVPQIIQHGRVIRPVLGITTADPRLARSLGVQGLLVLETITGSGAAEAGLQPTRRTPDGRLDLGDVITAVDGEPVADANDLYTILGERDVGDTVTVTVSRAGEPRDVRIILSAESR
jgi:S1-C subfamily serine protease